MFTNSRNKTFGNVMLESFLIGFLFSVICFLIIHLYIYTNKETIDPVTNKKTKFINTPEIKWLLLASFFGGIVFYLFSRQISLSSKYSKIFRQLQCP